MRNAVGVLLATFLAVSPTSAAVSGRSPVSEPLFEALWAIAADSDWTGGAFSLRLIETLVEAGEVEKAAQVASGLRDRVSRSEALLQIAGNAEPDNRTEFVSAVLDSALRAARASQFGTYRVAILSQIAHRMALIGRVQEASDVLEDALEESQRLTETADRLTAYAAICRAGRPLEAGRWGDRCVAAADAEFERVGIDIWSVSAWGLMAAAAFDWNPPEPALEWIRRLPGRQERDYALSHCVLALATEGPFAGGLDAARAIEDLEWRLVAYQNLGAMLLSVGEVEEARNALRDFWREVGALPAGQTRDGRLQTVASWLAKAGMADEAREAVEHIADPRARAWGALEAGQALTQDPQAARPLLELALDLAPVRGDAEEEGIIEYSCSLAVAFGSIGNAEQGMTILRRMAMPLLQVSSDLEKSTYFRTEIAEATAVLGEGRLALEVVERIADPADKDAAWGMVSGALARGGRFELATEVAAQIESVTERDTAFYSIAVARARARDFEGALAAADRIERWATGVGTTFGRQSALLMIGVEMVRAAAPADEQAAWARRLREVADESPGPNRNRRPLVPGP